MMNRWAIAGGVLGAGVVTGVGVWLAVRRLQTPAFSAATQAHAAGVAEAAANTHIETFYGMTPARMAQFQQIAARLR